VQPSLLLVVNGAAVPSGEAAERVVLASGDSVSLMPPVAGG
jgi:sulfur carrier protein ThiS